jgi:type IV secretion system protein VirB9
MRLLIHSGLSLAVLLATGSNLPATHAAERTSQARPDAADPRLRYVTYHVNRVVTIPAALGVSTMLQFAADEVVETVSAGDTKAWSIVPRKNSGMIFIKPLEADAETNMNVVTNKRIYALVLTTSSAARHRTAFQVRFRYPEDLVHARLLDQAREASRFPAFNAVDPNKVNEDYVFRGNEALKPRAAFDDGTKTFLAFSGEIPAIFLVKADGTESLVNIRREGDFVVIDKVHPQMTLRAGSETLCLYNRKVLHRPIDPVAEGLAPRPVDEMPSTPDRIGGGA